MTAEEQFTSTDMSAAADTRELTDSLTAASLPLPSHLEPLRDSREAVAYMAWPRSVTVHEGRAGIRT